MRPCSHTCGTSLIKRERNRSRLGGSISRWFETIWRRNITRATQGSVLYQLTLIVKEARRATVLRNLKEPDCIALGFDQYEAFTIPTEPSQEHRIELLQTLEQIQHLNVKYQVILLLRAFGYKPREIGKLLKIASKTVTMYHTKALKELRDRCDA